MTSATPRTMLAALAALLIASAASAQTPAAKDGIRNEPRDAPVSNRDSMPKTSAAPHQGSSGVVQEQATPKKK